MASDRVTNVRAGHYWKPESGPEHRAQRHERQAGRRSDSGDGAPRTYEELIRNYHGVVMSIAAKAGLSGDDAEDAAQMVEMRFWIRGGLEDYDPEKLFAPPSEGWSDGRTAVARTARFATMFKTYVILSMRGERDRALRWRARHVGEEEAEGLSSDDPGELVESMMMTQAWVCRATRRLVNAGWPEWAAAVLAASEGHLDKREEWAEILGCKVRSCRWAQDELSARLVAVGLGPESLRAC